MGEHVIKLPDVGEGIAEAELVEWHVKVGDLVREDAVLAAVMTDKATVEIPSPVDGEVLWLGAEIGDTVAVGSPIVRLEGGRRGQCRSRGSRRQAAPASRPPRRQTTPPHGRQSPHPKSSRQPADACRPKPRRSEPAAPARQLRAPAGAPRAEGEKPLASPAVRLRAREAGIDLRQVAGTGPAGRITHEDLDAFLARGPQAARPARPCAATTRSRTSRSSACAARSPRRWRWRSRASRTSPMSRRSTSPRSKICARAQQGEAQPDAGRS